MCIDYLVNGDIPEEPEAPTESAPPSEGAGRYTPFHLLKYGVFDFGVVEITSLTCLLLW